MTAPEYSDADFQRFLGRPTRCPSAPYCVNKEGHRPCEVCLAIQLGVKTKSTPENKRDPI